MKAIVGASSLWPTPALASAILTIMVSREDDFGIRCTSSGSPSSMTEEMVWQIGAKTGKIVRTFKSPSEAGSKAGYMRDVALVRAADEVFAFFGPDGQLEGGTSHVVVCALRSAIPVIAYGVDPSGSIVEIGSDPGSGLPSPFFDHVAEAAAWTDR